MKRFAAFSVAVLGSATLLGGAALAASQSNGPEPYSAPDPSYQQNQIDSSVTIKASKDTPSLTDNGANQNASGNQ